MQKERSSQVEFILLMASLMSIVALSIDALLPALPKIGTYLSEFNEESHQKIITFIFLGLGIGQLILGPLSDSFGRKPTVYIGFFIFFIASIICISTKNFEVMLLGRVLQGIGLASPRTMCIAIVRDSYSGDYMAKIISIVVMIFILVPVIAPTLGQLLIDHFDWKSIFTFNLIYGSIIVTWFWLRQKETLKPEYKIPFRISLFRDGTIAFFKIKPAVIYTMLSGFITGAFMVYLSTSQQIIEKQYDLAEYFPYIFGSSALSVGLSTFFNSQLVMRFGMKRIVKIALISFVICALTFVVFFYNHNPSIVVLMIFFNLQFFCIGFLFGNLRALAMEPLGHIAGIGSALNGFISTVMAVPIANFIGTYITTTVAPMFIGFLVFGGVSLVLFYGFRKMA